MDGSENDTYFTGDQVKGNLAMRPGDIQCVNSDIARLISASVT
jgi:hypothetical protein